jgi:hypothetical protein
MALLLGSETEQSVAAECPAGKVQVYEFECTVAGTLEKVAIHTSTTASGATNLWLGIYANSGVAGEPVKEAALAEGELKATPTTNALNEVTLTKTVALTQGTKYWLAMLPIGASLHYFKKTTGGSNYNQSSLATNTKLVAQTWVEKATIGPIHFIGTGTPTTLKGEAALKFGSSANLIVPLRGTATVVFGTSAKLSVNLRGTAALNFTPTAKLFVSLKSTAALNFTGAAKLVIALRGTTALHFTVTGKLVGPPVFKVHPPTTATITPYKTFVTIKAIGTSMAVTPRETTVAVKAVGTSMVVHEQGTKLAITERKTSMAATYQTHFTLQEYG